jgi:glyoxylate/hydroxypyruvate reductase
MTDTKLTVLIASYLEPEYVDQIRAEVSEIDVIYRPDLLGTPQYVADHSAQIDRTSEQEVEWQSLLAKADILFDFDQTHHEDLTDLAPNVRWIQGSSAGIGQFVHRMGYAEKTDWLFTTTSGVHARPLAEFCIMAMIMFSKNYLLMQAGKEQKHWERYGNTELAGKTVGVVGLGRIGRDIAKVCNFFDMTVIGSRRNISKTVDGVDSLYTPDNIIEMMPQLDYLVLATPHTPETDGQITNEHIRALKQGAVIINVARGAVIDQKAMTEALQDGHLLGAALDVFAVEPLPQDDPLWELPNVIVSPHSASTADSENGKITKLFITNLKHFLNDEPLDNVLDTDLLY